MTSTQIESARQKVMDNVARSPRMLRDGYETRWGQQANAWRNHLDLWCNAGSQGRDYTNLFFDESFFPPNIVLTSNPLSHNLHFLLWNTLNVHIKDLASVRHVLDPAEIQHGDGSYGIVSATLWHIMDNSLIPADPHNMAGKQIYPNNYSISQIQAKDWWVRQYGIMYDAMKVVRDADWR